VRSVLASLYSAHSQLYYRTRPSSHLPSWPVYPQYQPYRHLDLLPIPNTHPCGAAGAVTEHGGCTCRVANNSIVMRLLYTDLGTGRGADWTGKNGASVHVVVGPSSLAERLTRCQ